MIGSMMIPRREWGRRICEGFFLSLSFGYLVYLFVLSQAEVSYSLRLLKVWFSNGAWGNANSILRLLIVFSFPVL